MPFDFDQLGQEGEIVVDNISLKDSRKNITCLRAEIGFVFQQFNLYPHLTVLENITLAPVVVRKMKKAEAEILGREILGKVGIPEKADSDPAQLSGGNQSYDDRDAPPPPGQNGGPGQGQAQGQPSAQEQHARDMFCRHDAEC